MRRMYSVVRFYKLMQHIDKSVSVLISKVSTNYFVVYGEPVPRPRTSRRAPTRPETVCLRIPFHYQSAARPVACVSVSIIGDV